MTAEASRLSASTRVARVAAAAVPTVCAAAEARHPLRAQIGDRTIDVRPGWHGDTQIGGVCAEIGADPPLAWLTVERLAPWLDDADELLAGADPLACRVVAQALAELTATALYAPDAMPVRVVDRPAVPDAAIRLDLQLAALAATGARARASLQCLPATLPRLMHWWTLRSGRPALRSDLPVEVRVHIGSAALTLSDLQGLAAGDLILPDRLPLEAGRWQTRLLAGAERRPWARGYIEGELVVITETEPSNAPPATAAPTLPPLTVDIAFEIGARRLPLAELTRIAPGYIFDLGAQADGEIVDLVANGQRIGRGHLVLLGEALGVRVSQVDLHAHGEGQSAGSPAPGTP